MSKRVPFLSNKRGITLIELLVALIICTLSMGAIYRLFSSQSKAYVVQDQVVEVQQSIRNVMELIVRDLQMTGFDGFSHLSSPSTVKIEDYKPIPPYIVADDSITVWYKHIESNAIHSVTYSLNGTNLERQLIINGVTQGTELILENVIEFRLRCGIDGRITDFATQDGMIDNDELVNCGAIDNNRDKVIAININLSVGPNQANEEDDRFKGIAPRTLSSTVALRNLSMKKL